MKIDLHVHTRERSFCAQSTADEMIRAAIEKGLDGIAISDHDQLVPKELLAHHNAKYAPFQVFGGIEITTDGEHILVWGIDDPELARRWWSYPDLHRFVRDRGGLLAIAHPFRFDCREIAADLERYPPDALELASRNTPRSMALRIRELAEEVGALLVANSDAHRARDLGAYYNEFTSDPDSGEQLVTQLQAREFRPAGPGSGRSYARDTRSGAVRSGSKG